MTIDRENREFVDLGLKVNNWQVELGGIPGSIKIHGSIDGWHYAISRWVHEDHFHYTGTMMGRGTIVKIPHSWAKEIWEGRFLN